MPANPRIFGRQSYITKAVQLLLSATSTRIVILGPGGMGKTSVALKIAYDSRVIERFGINRRWVPCDQATSLPLFIDLIAKSLGIPPSSSNDRFGEIVAALEESNILVIVLFDNFETIWDLEGEQSAIANILSRLASIPSVSFILTMRGIQHPASHLIDWTSPRLPPLTPLEMDPAQEAFVKISPDSEGDPKLPELLRELDCVPLAITLMARLAEVGEAITELLSQWKQEQVRLLSQPGGDRTSSIEVSIRLSLTSLPVRMNPDAIPLLSILARLPGGASLERLPTICPSITGWKGALRVLRTAALVYDNPDKSVIRMLSPIRSYVMLHHSLAEGPLRDLRNAYFELARKGKAYHGDAHFDDVLTELSKEEINLDTIILDALHCAENKEDAITAAIWFSHSLNLTQPRVNVVEAAIQVARQVGSNQLGYCLEFYGDALRLLCQDDAACLALEEARERQIQLGNLRAAASCLWMLGDTLRMQNKYDEARTKLEEARRQYVEINFPSGAADCLLGMGAIYYAQGRPDIARSTIEEAKSQYIEVGAELGVANCLQALGLVYFAQGQYEEAISAAQEAKLGHTKLRDPLGLAHSVTLFSNIYYIQGQYSEAYSAAEEARSGYIRLGDKLAAAQSIELVGNILFKQGRYEEACHCAEEAENEYRRLGNSQGIAGSRRLLGDICRMKGEYDKAWTFLEEAKSLYSQQNTSILCSMGLADCNSSFGKISRLQGQYDNAIKLLEEARKTYSTLGSRKKDADECTEEIKLAVMAWDGREQAD
ncbi:hypothetical protein FRC03_008516 [Tulasnella sp. 419]|nr:hypothetical protein FRC03_008516 [Tulasnella sp. 419]